MVINLAGNIFVLDVKFEIWVKNIYAPGGSGTHIIIPYEVYVLSISPQELLVWQHTKIIYWSHALFTKPQVLS